MSYAIVQKTLEQTIDRKNLEEASIHVPSVARGDCVRLHRNLFGIVVTGLPLDEAVAFQVALEYFRFPTDIVPDAKIPRLPEPVIRRGIHLAADELIALDGLGRESRYPWREVQLAVGGFLETKDLKSERKLVQNPYYTPSSRGNIGRMFVLKKTEKEVTTKEFRMELYLSCKPYRLQFRAGKETLFRNGDAILRLTDPTSFDRLSKQIAQILPQEKQGLGIQAANNGYDFLYPSPSALEEETAWHLLQRLRAYENQ